MKIKDEIEFVRYWIKTRIKAIWLQIAGLALIVVAYVMFGKEHPHIGWFAVLVPVGIIELTLMIVFRTTITKRGRKLFRKWLDTTIMLGLIPLTWYLFGPTAAGMYFVGMLSNHFGEKQE